MFETRQQPVISRDRFLWRMAKFVVIALAIDAGIVLLGAIGYRLIGQLSWIDALLDSALVITGNGPIGALGSTAGKWFTLVDAVLGGVTFILVSAVLLSPVIHRVLHALHADPAPDDDATGV